MCLAKFISRNYHTLNFGSSTDLPDSCEQLKRLFKSEAMLVILSDLSGIRLHPVALIDRDEEEPERKHPRLDISDEELATLTEPLVRRFQMGDYSLLVDQDVINGQWRLEAILHLQGFRNPGTNNKNHADQLRTERQNLPVPGQIVYVAKDIEDDLLTVNPVDNALSLVYVGPDTGNFVKYINHGIGKELVPDGCDNDVTLRAYDLSVNYFESPLCSKEDTKENDLMDERTDSEDSDNDESSSTNVDEENGEYEVLNGDDDV